MVLWADQSSSNLGVRVLAEGAETLAHQAWGESAEVDFQSFELGPLGTQLTGKVVLRGLLTGSKELRSRISHYDAVLDTGAGDSFTDIYGLKRLVIMTYARFVAKQSKVPVVFAPQTIGPFKTALGRVLARYSLRAAHTVMARDSKSNDSARSLGTPADCLATDMAFALDQPAKKFASTDVLLNVSGLLWNSDAHLPKERYRALTREIIDGLLALDKRVTLLAHVIDNPSIDNDTSVVQDLGHEFGGRVSVFIPADLQQARSYIAASNIVIGARMHACLNALSVGVPTVPLAYSRKFAPLLGDIGWPHTVDLRTGTDVVSTVLALVCGHEDLQKEAALVRQHAEARLQNAVETLGRQLDF